MRILVDVYDVGGNSRLGEGPIRTALSASVRRSLDAAGTLTVEFPATDRRALALLENERQARVFVGLDDEMREFSAGRIRRQPLRIAESGSRRTITGPDTVGELARKSVLVNRVYDDRVENVIADLVALVPGWSLSMAATGRRWTGRLDSVSVLKGLLTVAEQTGLHFRPGDAPKLLEVGAFGLQIAVQAIGVGGITRGLTRNPNVLLVERLDMERSTQEIYNWLLPFGTGSTPVTLERVTRAGDYPVRSMTGPDGTTLYFIREDLSIATYGDQIERVNKYNNIRAADASEVAQINAANALYDAAAADLRRNAFEQTRYLFSARKPRLTIRPGDRLRLTYTGEVWERGTPATWVDIDGWFWVMSVTETASDAGLTVHLELSTIDRQREDAAEKLARVAETVEQLKFS